MAENPPPKSGVLVEVVDKTMIKRMVPSTFGAGVCVSWVFQSWRPSWRPS